MSKYPTLVAYKKGGALLPKILGKKSRNQVLLLQNFFSQPLLQIRTFLLNPNWNLSLQFFNSTFHKLNLNKKFQEKLWWSLAPNPRASFGQEGEQQVGSSFGQIAGAHSSVLVQGGSAQSWSKNLHKLRIFGDKIRDQTLGQNQPFQSKVQGKFLTLIPFIFMLKFEANLSVLMSYYVWA